MSEVITNIETRWEAGTPHHKHSIALMEELKEIDNKNGLIMDFRTGGDGDNGEYLLYYLDAIFEERERRVDQVILESDRCEHDHLLCAKCHPRDKP